MNWLLRELLGTRAVAVALVILVAGWASARGADDHFTAQLGKGGDLIRGDGAGFNHGSWYYYAGADWWAQWFLNGEVDLTRKKVVDVDLTVTVLEPTYSGISYFEAAVNWTKREWSDVIAPPMPDVMYPAHEARNIEWRRIVERTEIRETYFTTASIEISDFCPAWVSIDLRGENVKIEGRIRHNCVPKEGQIRPTGDRDFGDAPEGVIAYPAEGVVGMFPTCVSVGPASWIEHSSTGRMYFGPKVDLEPDGNGGKCPVFLPDQYNRDESVNDGDAGLIKPRAYTIGGIPGSQAVSALTFSGLESIGNACLTATWGTNIDIRVHNDGAGDRPAYVNVLFDWNHNGIWGDISRCGLAEAPEHVLVNFPVPNGYDGPLSVLNPSGFAIGPFSGYVWARFTITDQPVRKGWNGDGVFADGETEDYLLHVKEALKFCTWESDDPHAMHWAQLPDLRSSGIDVDLSWSSLADDFVAAQNGPLTGIHFWASFKDDVLPEMSVDSLAFEINIYADQPADIITPWNRPDKLLWTRQIPSFRYDFTEVSSNILEGWLDPNTWVYEAANHRRVYQYNICLEEDDDLFNMELGTTYWMEIRVIPSPDRKYQFGWKTARREYQHGGNAMWRDPVHGWKVLVYPDGHESKGKAMDLSFVVVGVPPKDMDFGDAPDPTYPTTIMSNGAQHAIVPTVYLGRGVDGEIDGQPNSTATGDDIVDTPDEDGIVFHSELIPGQLATIQATASTLGVLNAWIDWNADGDWDDVDEQIAVDELLYAGVNTLTIAVPERAAGGRTFARFRFSTVRGLRYSGLAPDGEVEDYQVEIVRPFELALPVEHIKWSQPPIEQQPGLSTPVYSGWDQSAHAVKPLQFSTASWKLAADDFRCFGDMPVSSVHWWGSYLNHKGDRAPSVKPESWRIAFWSNARADGRYAFSRPNELLWAVNVTSDRVREERAGTNSFPQKPSNTVFRYHLDLASAEYFYQGRYLSNTQDDVFWISVTAVYTGSATVQNPWGWLTRPRSWEDGAVSAEFRRDEIRAGFTLDPSTAQPIANSLLCERLDTYDLAFELDTDPSWIKWEQAFTGLRDWPYYEDEESLATQGAAAASKWTQLPDATSAGVAVDFSRDLPPTWPATICADDFECTESGPITSITLWGSWYHDVLSGGSAANATFTLSIRQDIPANRSSTGYSVPGPVLWRKTFERGQFTVEPVQTGAESYYSPANSVLETDGRATLYKYTFRVDAKDAFVQTGSSKSPVVYWLAAQVRLIHSPGSIATRLGWRTSGSHWNDAAVWVKAEEPYDGAWNKLAYPKGHSLGSRPIDLAFAVETERAGAGVTTRRIVADDWRCGSPMPISAISWWGSYIGFNYRPGQCPQATAPRQPDYFLLSLWSDVPDPDPGNPRDFGHPGRKLWEYKAETFDEVMVGFDNNPHPTAAFAPSFEPVYRYTVRLPENKWYRQDGLDNVLWLSVQAVYEDARSIVYPWGWTNHAYTTWDLGLVPLAHWKLDETAGNVASDSSGNGNDGSVLGDPVWRSSGGWLGGALEFDGRGDYIRVEKPKGFNFAPGSFSVSAWVYPKETLGRWHAIMEYDRDSLNGNRFGLWLDPHGRFHFRVGQNTWQSPSVLTPNRWCHLVATFEGASRQMKIYVDGVLEASATSQKGFVSPNHATLIIGARGSADDEYFTGLMDDIRVFKVDLTAEEVLVLSGAGRNEGAVAAEASAGGAENWKQLLDPTGLIEDMSFMLFTQPVTVTTAGTKSGEGSGEIVVKTEEKKR